MWRAWDTRRFRLSRFVVWQNYLLHETTVPLFIHRIFFRGCALACR